MRLELALGVLALCACTQPTVPHQQSPAAATAAGAGGAGAAGAGADEPEAKGKSPRAKPSEEATDIDAGSGDDDPGEVMEPVTTTDAGMTTDAAVVSGGASGAAAMPPVDAGSVAPDVVGTWYGPNEDALGRDSTACVKLTQVGMVGPAGDTRYVGALNCTGRLSFLETVDGVHAFEEVATSGVGCPSGTLRLTPLADGTLNFNFFFNAGDIPDGVGILNRVDACP